MYLDEIAKAIREKIPADRMPNEGSDELLRIYAVLARAKGTDVTSSDIHDAWSAWMFQNDPSHESLVPYDQLPETIKDQDTPFADAIRSAALDTEHALPSRLEFMKVLFPSGLPENDAQAKDVLELYKIMVTSSESLV